VLRFDLLLKRTRAAIHHEVRAMLLGMSTVNFYIAAVLPAVASHVHQASLSSRHVRAEVSIHVKVVGLSSLVVHQHSIPFWVNPTHALRLLKILMLGL
jgi:hypothetical protein